MKKTRFIFTAAILFVAFSIFAPIGQAQMLRTFVSSDGKDNNPCGSFDKPCRNISLAVSKVQAGGEVVILDSGNYQPLTINKAVDIVAAPGAHPGMIVTSGTGIMISVEGARPFLSVG